MIKFFLAAALAASPVAAFAQHADGETAKEASMQAHHRMMAAMNAVQPTGEADRDFVRLMIPHHQGAIDMAKVELQYGHDETLRAMAEEIVAAQQKEIGEMEAWLKANPEDAPAGAAGGQTDHGHN
jgi:uncharacterized protein (DUF305 family)